LAGFSFERRVKMQKPRRKAGVPVFFAVPDGDLYVVVLGGAGHHFFSKAVGLGADCLFEAVGDFGVLLQVSL
jgi:hypothetical protein